jgi:hypothetical protein
VRRRKKRVGKRKRVKVVEKVRPRVVVRKRVVKRAVKRVVKRVRAKGRLGVVVREKAEVETSATAKRMARRTSKRRTRKCGPNMPSLALTTLTSPHSSTR